MIFVVVIFFLALWLVLTVYSWYNEEGMVVNRIEVVVEVEEEDVESLINIYRLVVGLRCWMKWGELL